MPIMNEGVPIDWLLAAVYKAITKWRLQGETIILRGGKALVNPYIKRLSDMLRDSVRSSADTIIRDDPPQDFKSTVWYWKTLSIALFHRALQA